jgi:hypothetical protein
METLLPLLANLPAIWQAVIVVLGAASALLTALIALFVLVPGAQPEKALQAMVDAIKKISLK